MKRVPRETKDHKEQREPQDRMVDQEYPGTLESKDLRV